MGLNEIIKIGDKIKAYRKENNLTQAEMAQKLEIPRSTYAHYENNTREPSMETLKKITEIFDISLETLVGKLNSLDAADKLGMPYWYTMYPPSEEKQIPYDSVYNKDIKKYSSHFHKLLDIIESLDNNLVDISNSQQLLNLLDDILMNITKLLADMLIIDYYPIEKETNKNYLERIKDILTGTNFKHATFIKYISDSKLAKFKLIENIEKLQLLYFEGQYDCLEKFVNKLSESIKKDDKNK